MEVSNQTKIVGNSKVDSILDYLEKLHDQHAAEQRTLKLVRDSERIEKEVQANLAIYRVSRIGALETCVGIEGYLLEKLSNDQLAILTDNSLQKIQRKAKWAKYLPKAFVLLCPLIFLGAFDGNSIFIFSVALSTFIVGLLATVRCLDSSCKKFVEARNYLQKNGVLRK